MRKSALLLRIVHAVIVAYFTFGLLYLYYVGLTGHVNDVLFGVLTITMALECAAVFLFNDGDCPLIHVQRRLGDDTPFFEVIFPRQFAKYAIQIYAGFGLVAVMIILFRFVIGAN